MADERVAEIRRRHQAATAGAPGPWTIETWPVVESGTDAEAIVRDASGNVRLSLMGARPWLALGANAAADIAALLELLDRLRDLLQEYGGHRRSCSRNLSIKREMMLVAALEQVILADADYWERVRHIARNTLEYRDAVVEAQGRQPPPGVCTCGWADIEPELLGPDARPG